MDRVLLVDDGARLGKLLAEQRMTGCSSPGSATSCARRKPLSVPGWPDPAVREAWLTGAEFMLPEVPISV